MTYSKETNLVVQSALSAVLLMDLSINSKGFIESDFFNSLETKTINKVVYQFYKTGRTGVGNQGAMLMCLYSVLVLPKELLGNKYAKLYKQINQAIAKIGGEVLVDSYREHSPNYVKHIRNAIAHAQVRFDESQPSSKEEEKNIFVTFTDKKGRKKFEVKFHVSQIPKILLTLLKVHDAYLHNLPNH